METLWNTVAVDYGNIVNSHPAIYKSNYINGSSKGELGAQRKLEFNKRGTKALSEKIVAWNPDSFTYDVKLEKAEGFPINEEVTLATLTFKSLGVSRSSFQFDFLYGTKPRFMAKIAKGKFSALLEDYMISLEHYLLTGEKVNAEIGNFKEVKLAYKKRHANDPKTNGIAIN